MTSHDRPACGHSLRPCLLGPWAMGHVLLANRRLQTLLLFWLDVKSLENMVCRQHRTDTRRRMTNVSLESIIIRPRRTCSVSVFCWHRSISAFVLSVCLLVTSSSTNCSRRDRARGRSLLSSIALRIDWNSCGILRPRFCSHSFPVSLLFSVRKGKANESYRVEILNYLTKYLGQRSIRWKLVVRKYTQTCLESRTQSSILSSFIAFYIP